MSKRRGIVIGLAAALLGSAVLVPAEAVAPTTFDSEFWQANGRVRKVIETDHAIYLAGNFTALNGPNGQSVARNRLAALDPETGAPLAFNPNVNRQIWSLALSPDAQTVYFGGDFSRVGNSTRRRVAAVDATTGALTAWNPNADQRVLGIAASNTHVYIGGEFTTLAGQPRARLAAVSPGTGAVDPSWSATANDRVNDIELTQDGSSVLVGGLFGSISGSSGNSNRRIASLDPVTGFTKPWISHPNLEIFEITVTRKQAFAAAGGSGGHAIAFDLATGQEQWTGFGNGDATGIAYQNGVLYIGGHFTVWNGETARHVIAVEPTTGQTVPWSLRINSALGVFTVYSHKGHLSLGGDFTKINYLPRARYARYTEAVDVTPPSQPGKPTAVVSGPASVDVTWDASTDNQVSGIVYQVFRDGGSTPVGEVTSSSTGTVTFTDTGLAPESTHNWQVQADDGNNYSEFSEVSDDLTMPDSPNPQLVSMEMFDVDHDGRVDEVVAQFSQDVTCTDPCVAPWTLTNVPSGGTLASATASGSTVTLSITEGSGSANTAVGDFTISLAADVAGVVDAEGDPASFFATAPADKAGPVPIDITSYRGATDFVMEPGDTFTAIFSEPIAANSVIAANVKETDPFGPGNDTLIIVGLTNGPMDLGADDYVLPDNSTIVFQNSTLTLTNNNTRIVSTIAGPCSGTACGQHGAGSEHTVTFVPEPFLKDLAGNGAMGSHTESEGVY